MRLIDADAFTEQISAAVLKNGTGEAAELGINIIRLVDAQPTAYDVERVAEQLEELKMAEYDDSDEAPCFTDVEDWYDEGVSAGKYKAYNRAVEIVRNGGKE